MFERPAIDVRAQVQLSLRKSFRFCLKGISYRLFRSMLTLAVVVVAVAFFMVLLSESVIVRSISHGVTIEVEKMREADMFLTHLFHPHSMRDLSVKLSAMVDSPELIDEFSKVSGVSPEKAEELVRYSGIQERYLSFFAGLAVGKRVVLVKKNKDLDIFNYLDDDTNRREFFLNLSHMRSVRFPGDEESLTSFLEGRAGYIEDLRSARDGWHRNVGTLQSDLNELMGGNDVASWMTGASDAQVQQWRNRVVTSGFILGNDTMKRLKEILIVSSYEADVTRMLLLPDSRRAWKKAFLSSPPLQDKLLQLMDPRAMDVLGEFFTADQLKAVSDRSGKANYLREIKKKLPLRRPGTSEPRFLDGQQFFLVVISFLVCMVGIANAMLMAITERFREIATMKCLGATDGFILRQFLIEAAIQGVIGGTAGMLIGLFITLIKSFVIFGLSTFLYLPAAALLYCSLFTVVIGVLLAMLASIYPSRAAALMAPMEAMRVE